MDSMVTDEQIQQVVDAATDFVLMQPQAGGKAINGQLARHHVHATLSFLAQETERRGIYEAYDDLIHYLATQPGLPLPIEDQQ